MRVSAALLFFPLAFVFAQTASQPKPPPGVDEALRARVNEFFQAHVDGKFVKAYALVADDTKEYYFAAQKVQLTSYKIGAIKYFKDFTDAEVDVTGQRMWVLRPDLPPTVVPAEMKTHWKIEDGKWMFYTQSHRGMLAAMGPSDMAAIEKKSGSSDALPSLKPQDTQALAQSVLQQRPALDKSEVLLPLDKASSEEIVFHNTLSGSVRVYLEPGAPVAGFSAKLDKAEVAAGENAIVTIHFDPKDAPQAPGGFSIRLISEPLDRVYPIAIKFAPRQPAP